MLRKFKRDLVFIILFHRGHQVRQDLNKNDSTEEPKNEEEEEIDIDLNDPQTEEAAVKIQVLLIQFIIILITQFGYRPYCMDLTVW